MISKMKLLPLALVALLAIVVAACGGSGGSDDSGADTPESSPPERDVSADDTPAGDQTEPDLFVSSGREVLTRSVDSFAGGQVTSMTGDVTFQFSMGTTAVTGNADFAYQDPDQMHMALTFEGGDQTSVVDLSQFGTLEVLVRDGALYMNIPFLGGWFMMTPEDLGEGSEAIADILERGSLFDYEAFVGQITEDLEYVGGEDVNGHSTAHYRLTGDLQSLIGSFADALGATGDNAFADQILGSELNGPIAIDLWVGKDDFLPYRMNASATIGTPEGNMVMDLSANFDNFNEPVEIPAAPADAASLAEILGGLGLDPDMVPSE